MTNVSQRSPTLLFPPLPFGFRRVSPAPSPVSDVSCLEFGQVGYTHYLYGASVAGAPARDPRPRISMASPANVVGAIQARSLTLTRLLSGA